jgi:hypothetical protein
MQNTNYNFSIPKVYITFVAGVLAGAIINTTYNNSKKDELPDYEDMPVMIWNDDWESIPPPGELVEVEIVTEDTIYFGPLGGRPF